MAVAYAAEARAALDQHLIAGHIRSRRWRTDVRCASAGEVMLLSSVTMTASRPIAWIASAGSTSRRRPAKNPRC
jgi:hypothetical protein